VSGPIAKVALRGGPRQGVYDIYSKEVTPETLPIIYPGYEVTWTRDEWDDSADPMAEYEWAARMDWRGPLPAADRPTG